MMRGYLVRKNTILGVMMERFRLNVIYFDKMKFKLWSEAAVIVQRYVRRWLERTVDDRAFRWRKNLKRKSNEKLAADRRARKSAKERLREAVRAAMGMSMGAKIGNKNRFNIKHTINWNNAAMTFKRIDSKATSFMTKKAG